MTYKQVKLEEGKEVQYVGVYALKWNIDWGQPEVGFTEVDYTLQDALDELDIENWHASAVVAKNEVIEILNKLAGMDND